MLAFDVVFKEIIFSQFQRISESMVEPFLSIDRWCSLCLIDRRRYFFFQDKGFTCFTRASAFFGSVYTMVCVTRFIGLCCQIWQVSHSSRCPFSASGYCSRCGKACSLPHPGSSSSGPVFLSLSPPWSSVGICCPQCGWLWPCSST